MCFLLPLAIFTITITVSYANLELITAQSIFRHGDRAPSNPYPYDNYGIEHWQNGWSQLTKLGADQCQDLGKYYHDRYVKKLGLLENGKLLEQVHMRSTSKKRAIESAENVMLGMMGSNIDYSNMEVHENYKKDLLLKPNSVKCLKYHDILKHDNHKLFHLYDNIYKEVFKNLSMATGYNVKMSTVKHVFDAVYRESIHGLAQPDWLKEKVYDPLSGRFITMLDLVVELKRVQRMNEFNSEIKAKLRTGYLVGQIVEYFNNATNGNVKAPLQLYSSHDATLTSLLYSMGVSDHQLTPYAAAITLELYKDLTGPHNPSYYVKMFYRKETGSNDVVELVVPGCATPVCEFGLFKELLKEKIVGSWEEHEQLCQLE